MFKEFIEEGITWENILMFVIALLLVFLVGLLVYSLGDRIGAEEKSGVGTVINREHKNSHTTSTLMGKMIVPQFHPESWKLCITIENNSGCAEVSKEYYDTVPDGATVGITYYFGNWTNDLYIKTIQWQ